MPDQLSARLLVCGAGLRPGELTVEALEALGACRAVLLLPMPAELASWLRERLPAARDLSGLHREAGAGGDAAALAAVEEELGRGGDVGAVLAGHPLLYSPGARLAALAAERGAPCRVLAGVSACDGVLAAVEPWLTGQAREAFNAGMLVCDPRTLAAADPPLDRRQSTLVLNLGRVGKAGRRRLLGRLSRAYGPRWESFLVAVGAGGGRVQRLPLGRLADGREELDGATLFVPGRPR